jgi:flagellar basal-body rod protein FlgB
VLDRLDAALSFHQNALRVRGQRQELIAANIANADTPDYKARDMDFAAAMKSASAGIDTTQAFKAAQNMTKTSAQHLAGVLNSNSGLPSGALYRPIVQGSVDGNTVDMDVERNQFADNAIRYEASLTMINGQIKKMLAALQSQ